MSSVLVEHEATVKQYAEALDRLNAELEQRVAERTAALQRSNEELQQFAHMVSHDLKEPLRGMHNYAHLLLEDLGSTVSGEARAKLQTISSLAQRMEGLINSLLHFCRLGQENLAYEDTDVSMVVHEVLNLLHITLVQQGIEVRMPQPLPVVRCDRARVREVFHNLILNAIKYNDKPHKWVHGDDFRHVQASAPTRRLRRWDWSRPDHCQKNYRTPWRHSPGGVDLWRRLNLLFYAARECHAL